jgi:hypothetical protein
MKIKIVYTLIILFSSAMLAAQVPVSKEPLHKKVLENKYIRLLDVWIQPGDTTLFHVHSTPSVFLQFTNTNLSSQIKDSVWVKERSEAGKSWFRSFSPGKLVHRVSNCDSIPFHVTDIEILSSYKTTTLLKPLPFTLLYDNEWAVAYQLTGSSFNKQPISGRGPMIAELVAGKQITFHDLINNKISQIRKGKYLYIEPGSSFYFSTNNNDTINLVLFEFK